MTTSTSPVVTGFTSTSAAEFWERGVVAGDGRLGAILWGRPGHHRVTLSHEVVVLPTDPVRSAPLLAPDLPTFRRLIREGKAQDAAELAVRRAEAEGYDRLQWTDPIVPVAELSLDGAVEHADRYRRDVDLRTGVVEVTWRSAGVEEAIRLFVSRADRVAVLEVRGGTEPVRLGEPGDTGPTTTSGVRGGNAGLAVFEKVAAAGASALLLRFTAPWAPVGSGALTRVRTLASNEDRALLVVDVVPSAAADPARSPDLPTDWDVLLRRHEHALRAQVRTTTLDLGAIRRGAPVEELMAGQDGQSRDELLEIQHRAAQHLIASSTGEFAPTLQGIWSGTFDPAWSSDYTMNGNVQTGAISSMLSTGNAPALRTYLDMLERFGDDFRENARRLYGASGFVLPSRCSIRHGRTTHFDERHCHEFWTAGGAWAAASFFDLCWTTADLDYLRDHAYPFGREVERFYEDFLVWEDDRIVFVPSYSPENTSPTFGSQACRNATQDRAVLAVLLRDLLRASSLLGVDEDLGRRRRAWVAALPDHRVAPDGSLAEWTDDGVEERLGHRTASHLLELWFELDGPAPAWLRDAVRTTVRRKLDWRASPQGKEEMAYGLVQLGLAAAAVGDAEGALECVDRMSRHYFLPSLSTTHDVGAIFNVDIAGGLPAVVHAMLVRSGLGTLDLVPALPERWAATGGITGVHARGGIVVEDLRWAPSSVSVRLRALPGSRHIRGGEQLRVSTDGRGAVREVDIEDGEVRTVELAR